MSLQTTKPGACFNCRYFIRDRNELSQELNTLARRHPMLIAPMRTAGPETFVVHHRDGSTEQVHTQRNETRREVLSIRDLAAALSEWFPQIDPANIGLCEKGVATLVMADAGSTPGTECSKWSEQGQLVRIRTRDWRERRAEALAKAGLTAVGPNDPCPCKSGQKFGDCHAKKVNQKAR